MFRKLFNFIALILAMAVLVFLLTGVWIVYDGTHDNFHRADVALVPGYEETEDGDLSPSLRARLDRAATLYKEGKFPYVVVSGVTPPGENDETDAMAHYLREHGVEASAIIQDHRGEKASDTVDNIVGIMKKRFNSVIVITDYERITRMKLVLYHEGVLEIGQAHAGDWKKEDTMAVLHEDLLIYQDLNQWYALPAEEKISARFGGGWEGEKDSINHFLNPELKK
jgi:vancomycin permeability regulator SanA